MNRRHQTCHRGKCRPRFAKAHLCRTSARLTSGMKYQNVGRWQMFRIQPLPLWYEAQPTNKEPISSCRSNSSSRRIVTSSVPLWRSRGRVHGSLHLTSSVDVRSSHLRPPLTNLCMIADHHFFSTPRSWYKRPHFEKGVLGVFSILRFVSPESSKRQTELLLIPQDRMQHGMS
eukprot:scaffold7257_cov177-Amphora_coffeaeformis.AAC.2